MEWDKICKYIESCPESVKNNMTTPKKLLNSNGAVGMYTPQCKVVCIAFREYHIHNLSIN